jgi:hypothetical protein
LTAASASRIIGVAYSSRNTLIGSTLNARRAGVQHAASATSVSSARVDKFFLAGATPAKD